MDRRIHACFKRTVGTMKTCKSGLHQYEPGSGCPECQRVLASAWHDANPGRNRALAKAWSKINPERIKAWRKANSKRVKELNNTSFKKWAKNNPGKHAANTAKYIAVKLQRTPKWLNKEQLKEIEQFYVDAQYIQQLTLMPMNVDHIVPLKGKNVWGLHVPWNLQILTKKENQSKGNK